LALRIFSWRQDQIDNVCSLWECKGTKGGTDRKIQQLANLTRYKIVQLLSYPCFTKISNLKCHETLESTNLWCNRSLFLGWKRKKINFTHQTRKRSNTSDIWSWLSIEKLKCVPRYLNESPLAMVGSTSWFRISLGRHWTDEVDAFFIPKVKHLSTRIFMFAQAHQREKWFSSSWLSFSRLVIMAASSGNWNQWTRRERSDWETKLVKFLRRNVVDKSLKG